MPFRKITIINIRKKKLRNINDELQWVGNSIGLFGNRDKDKSCFRIFIALVRNIKEEDAGLSSDELAERLNLTRGTVVHHLNRLMDTGIVVNEKGRYLLRANNIEETIKIIKNNIENSFEELEQVAKYIDEKLEL